jgi:uncharacterized protein (DUF58 family)
MKALQQIYLTRFFFLLLGGVVLLFVFAFFASWMLFVAATAFFGLIGAALFDGFFIFMDKNPLNIERKVENLLNLGDSNSVKLSVTNLVNHPLKVELYDTFPVQVQDRKTVFVTSVEAHSTVDFSYAFTPKQRGEYLFGSFFVLLSSPLFLVKRKLILPAEQKVQVFPSILQMKKMELQVFHQQTQTRGLKKVRRIGHNNEFEQIKNYVQGDDLRSVNWKATSKRSELMVNQYQEERSQSIYTVIDKSRNMQSEFEGMTLLDYAINSGLVFSNIALKKGDKAGLITFSDKTGTQLSADRSTGHLRRILQALYNQQTHFRESSFELLYESIRQTVKTRSLLMLYTNFESEYAMRRALPTLKRINKRHVLVVVFFQNNPLEEMAYKPAKSIEEIYESAVAERLILRKSTIAKELIQNGIQTILTRPEDLSVTTINKYLELKAKGVI